MNDQSGGGHRTYGVVCPTLTPLDAGGAPCVDMLVDHCRWVLAEGCQGIVLFGTTGEANSFTLDERRAVLEEATREGLAADTLIVGTGCCALGDTVALTRHALASGCHRVLVLPPFYYKHVSPEGVIEAYSRIIEMVADTRLRLYFYRIPQFSGVDIGPVVVEALLARYPDAVAGLKDSSGDWPTTQALCAEFGGTIDILVGSERFLTKALNAGASGCVTATANVSPRSLRALYDSRDPAAQETATARRAVFESMPSIAALKEMTAQRTGDARWRDLRPPLRPLLENQAAEIATALARRQE